MKRHLIRSVALSIVITATMLLFSGHAIAQSTTSSLRVVVTDANNQPAAGVPVSIRHEPTGRTQIITSAANGVVTARGLAVGGPYTVNAAGSEYTAEAVQDISLELDETEIVALQVRTGQIEEITVVAQQLVQEIRSGVGRDFNRAEIDATPSIARDFIETLAREPKILVDNSVARGPAVSMAGQNFRFNSVTIDGVAQNDNFGLSKNASATQRTPISIDAIEAINVNIAPYDVTYGNFIGGNINIVTKSGTND
ncbi:MAG: carboxypeptidase regulatory-like domain-containing protein, partial [Woeseiaceae bacterium]